MTDIKKLAQVIHDAENLTAKIVDAAALLTALVHEAKAKGIDIHMANVEGYSVRNGMQIEVRATQTILHAGTRSGPKRIPPA